MALSTIVKMSSINNLSDARYCAGMGVDLMGFCIDPSKTDFLTPLQFKEITGWLAGVKMVAETGNLPLIEIKEKLKDYKFDYIEVRNKEEIEGLAELGKHFIYKVEDVNHLPAIPEHADIHYYLLKGTELDSNALKVLKDFSKKHSVILGFGINKKNIKDLLSKTHIKGIELKGGSEISPGLKDFDDLADILEILEMEE
jgi:phosphoribosylanthranilate isomerase